jgi:hypothetical protein
MTLAQIQALVVGQTVLYTPTGERLSQPGTVLQNGPDIFPPPPALTPPLFPPVWLRIRLHDSGGTDRQLDFIVDGDIPELAPLS